MTLERFRRHAITVLIISLAAQIAHTEARRDGGAEFSLGLHAVKLPKNAPPLRASVPPREQTTTPADIVVTIPPDVLARAGIETAVARRGVSTGGLRIPATVQPNAYRQVAVLSTSAGRVLSVFVELGQRVAKGDPLVQLHSPELADVERAYVSTGADLTLARQQLTRLERLVAIGAASQQELDTMRAQQTRLAADVEGARARLLLLGRTAAQVAALGSPGAIDPAVTIVAPMAGTVTTRSANPGQTIDASAPLVTVVDLDTVWIIGDAYERDVASVGVGSPVTMTSAALPGQTFAGRVAYVDPQIVAESRTARVRVEAANPGGRLRLGMLMEMRVNAAPGSVVMIPKTAVQTIGAVPVVYVSNPQRPGTFVERTVRLGTATGDDVEVVAGITAGEAIVTAGSFLVRSERDRVNLGPPHPMPDAGRASGSRPAPAAESEIRTFDIAITDKGFTPAEITVPANTRIRLRFTRQVEQTCATEVVFPALKIQRALPVGKPVVVDVPPQPAGRLAFACGMDMFKGQVVIK